MTSAHDQLKAAGLDSIVRRIVTVAQPERIILFGSRSRGDAQPDSDADLLVVVGDARERHHLAVQIREAIGAASIPVDIVIRDRQELLTRARLPGSIERAAARDGLIVYAAAS
jgi:predicted nucleotidyltransferase